MKFVSPFDYTFSKSKAGRTPLINPTFTSLLYLAFTVGIVIPVSHDFCLKDFLPNFGIHSIIDFAILPLLNKAPAAIQTGSTRL